MTHALPDDPAVDKKDMALRAQRFRMLEDIAEELSSRDVSFPTCFDAALMIRDALRDPGVSLRRVAGLIGMEPLVLAKVLRVANSAALNPSGRAITDIETAVTRIGVEATRTIAISTAMDQLLRSKGLLCFGELPKALWLHTLRTAATARVIAGRLTRVNREEAMMAGLVHDLGAFYMLYRATQYEELRIRPDSVKHLIAQWHESIGESLMHALGLPETIIQATREHEQSRPLERGLKTLEDVVYVANALAGGTAGWLFGSEAPTGAPVPLDEEQLASLADDIEAEYQSLLGALS
ncbi:HDOD domain-containing protein [Denitromonas iodatirespirans]|uniref:HDOD domain-containing protein n=1 Tax=Denitromonas iodatirespirans TaxID=2795389 RepID=A0A944DCI4_DENI1|nr:HDOD domain-containing protein [Denitromonas iodatirespirans]MBT0963725.1 HDOD domain-containing protein [Denitromonas iodatirespirans]